MEPQEYRQSTLPDGEQQLEDNNTSSSSSSSSPALSRLSTRRHSTNTALNDAPLSRYQQTEEDNHRQEQSHYRRLPLLSSVSFTNHAAKSSQLHRSTRRPSLPPNGIMSEGISRKASSAVPSPDSPSSPSHADAFMASLLRAARPSDIETQHQLLHRQRPMSVSSIVDSPSDNDTSDALQGRRSKRQRTTLIRTQSEGRDEERRQGGNNNLVSDQNTQLYHSSHSSIDGHLSQTSKSSNLPSPLLLSMTKVSPPSFLQPLPRNHSLVPSYTTRYATAANTAISQDLDRQKPTFYSAPTFDWSQHHPSTSSFTSSSASSSSSSRPTTNIPSRSTYTTNEFPIASTNNASSSRDHLDLHLQRSYSSGSSSFNNSVYTSKAPPTSIAMSTQDDRRVTQSIKANKEEQRWASLTDAEKSNQVRENILLARNDLVYSNNQWPPRNSIVTSIRCMYANIAQKSYGSEKRFLCPPPVVKIDGPLRHCNWACARVVSGDSSSPTSISMQSTSTGVASISGEEEALIDADKEARFGRLHVGNLTESRGKTFRLQVNLIRGEETTDAITRQYQGERIGVHQDSISQVIAAGAWSTFHTAPISVISKPARKSAKTRAASPAISSGSIICLYNRLNSQTVRTKYLSLETEMDRPRVEGLHRLMARQDRWEGFAIELLARPVQVNGKETGSKGSSAAPIDGVEITYGSIVCLRDVNTNYYSEPMLICKVEKGKVDVSGLIGNSTNSSDMSMKFEMVGKDKLAVREVLIGGRSRQQSAGTKDSTVMDSLAATLKVDSPERSSESPGSATVSKPGQGTSTDKSKVISTGPGGAVIQMQKVTLMQVSPRLDDMNSDIFECNLASPRSYLCSTAFEGAPDVDTFAAVARSRKQLQSRFKAVKDAIDQRDEEEETLNSSMSTKAASTQASLFPIGFVRPPSGVYRGENGKQIDVLEDPFCWTIVTISQTEVSFIEANAKIPTSLPHIPATLSPITPFPCVAALPSYDYQNHAVAATIQDFFYNNQHHLSSNSRFANNLCAIGNNSNNNTSSNSAHEIWLGHFGPLNYRCTSAGPHMSDVTIQLPSMMHLQSMHDEFHGKNNNDDITINKQILYLPILFVRADQGITFISGHWLQAKPRHPPTVTASAPSYAGGSIDSASSWKLAII